MHNWTELQPKDYLKTPLRSAAAQAKVINILGAQFHPGDYDDLEQVSQDPLVNIVSR